MTRKLLTALTALLLVCLISVPAMARQTSVPKNLVLAKDGKYQPAAGYTWVSDDANDLRVRWVSSARHPTQANVVAGLREGTWSPAAGYKWLNNTEGDLRVVKAGPSDEDIRRAVLKAIGAVALHHASKPDRDDNFFQAAARVVARAGRDKLIDSTLEDLLPDAKAVERAAISGLCVLALDGELPKDRDDVVARLRKANPDMASAVEVAEFLIKLAKAASNR